MKTFSGLASAACRRVRAAADGFQLSPQHRTMLPAMLSMAFCWFNLNFRNFGGFGAEYNMFDLGGFFLAGLPHGGILLNMPLFEILVAGLFHLGVTERLLLIALLLGVYGMVFAVGRFLGGYRAGLAALCAAGLFGFTGGLIYEQTFYSYQLLVVLFFLVLRSRENSLRNNIFCGLSIGASLLVRTPLFLFPPLLVACDWLGARVFSRAFVLRSLALLVCSYALLLPWGGVNYSITGKFELLDSRRAADNIITAARGSIFTAEADTQKAAGLASGFDIPGYFFRETAKEPFFYLGTVLRRLWRIFLFYPALFGLFLVAAYSVRDGKDRALFTLPGYFILIHALFSIEVRYFYPLLYLLPPLIAGVLLPGPDRDRPRWLRAPGEAASDFAVLMCFVAFTEVVLLAYPGRAAGAAADGTLFTKAAQRFPHDRALHEQKCREIWGNGDYPGFKACLGEGAAKFDDKVSAYFLASAAAPAPAAMPEGTENEDFFLKCLLIRTLRLCELGDGAAAAASLKNAQEVFVRNYNRLHGTRQRGAKQDGLKSDAEPYARDKVVAALLAKDSGRFWSMAYDVLTLWPVPAMGKILAVLEKAGGLQGRPGVLAQELAAAAKDGARGLDQLRRKMTFELLLLPFPRPGSGANIYLPAGSAGAFPGTPRQRLPG
ncbi:MAG TPA: hypothetical protein PKI19_05805 [Elusimicrobiales bacterium]|nr:hypothetical protein [Elusimicrobiales bacterium]